MNCQLLRLHNEMLLFYCFMKILLLTLHFLWLTKFVIAKFYEKLLWGTSVAMGYLCSLPKNADGIPFSSIFRVLQGVHAYVVSIRSCPPFHGSLIIGDGLWKVQVSPILAHSACIHASKLNFCILGCAWLGKEKLP